MINYSYVLVGLISFLNLTLGIIVCFRDHKNTINRSFFWFTLWTTIWIISNFLENEPNLRSYGNLLLKIDFASAFFLAYYFFFFCINFPRKIYLSLYKKFIFFIVPLTFFILSFFNFIIKDINFYDNIIKFERGVLYWIYAAVLISYMIIGCLNLVLKFKKSSGLERTQLFYVLSGFILSASLALMINLILTQLISVPANINRIGIYGILFFIVFTTYAITKHHLMDIKVIATELLTFAIWIFLLARTLLSEGLKEYIINGTLFIAVVFFGILLIRSILREVRQREHMEILNKKVQKAYILEKKARAEIEKITEAKTQFIMATQHHLRTPLTSMIGYLDLIFGGTYGKVSAKLKVPLTKFQVSSRRLIRVVNALLDISQFQMGKQVVTLQPGIKFDDLIKEVVEELEFEAKMKGLYIKYDKKGEVPTIKADPEKLKVALFNIIDNAIKYTKKGGITLTLQKAGTNARFSVKDTGIGLEPEKAKVLFKSAFLRGKEAKKVHGFGRGIGVYVTGHIINAHKGKIWAESEGKGKGTTFFIEL